MTSGILRGECGGYHGAGGPRPGTSGWCRSWVPMRKLFKVLVWILAGLVMLALGATAVARVIAGRKYSALDATRCRSRYRSPSPRRNSKRCARRGWRLALRRPIPWQAWTCKRRRRRGQSLAGNIWSERGWVATAATAPTWAEKFSSIRSSSATGPHRISPAAPAASREPSRPRTEQSGSPRRPACRPVLVDAVNQFRQLLESRAVGHRRLRSSRPAVDRATETVGIEPLFSYIVAFNPDILLAFTIDHNKAHSVEPPIEAASVELGQHIAQVCKRVPRSATSRAGRSPAIPTCRSLPTSRRTRPA